MKTRACLALAALAAPLAFGDGYQFFRDYADFESAVAALSAAAEANSHSAESAATALDGVNRTVAESAPTYLYTDKKGPSLLLLR